MLDYTNSATIYVSQTEGEDRLSGFSSQKTVFGEGPVKTLERVLDIIYNMRAGGAMQPLTVKVMGDYFLEETFNLGFKYSRTWFDHGTPFNNITFEGFDGRSKIIGGKRLTGFKKDVFNGTPCVSLHIPEVKTGEWKFTDLYVNGKRASLTRYPESGNLKAVSTEGNPKHHVDDIHKTSKWFTAHKEDLENIENVEDCIVSYYHYWIDEHSPVESYDRESGRLTMALRSRFAIGTNYEKDETCELYYYLENVAQTFSKPNEWYLDVKKGMLYYIPENADTEPSELEIYAPTLQQLVCIKGTSDNPLHGIRFRNIDFFCTSGDYVSVSNLEMLPEGESGYASDIQSVYSAPGAVSFEYACDCEVTDCAVTCTGLHAVEIGLGCDTVRVENCRMENLGGGGVKIFGGKVDEPAENATKHIVVKNNLIKNVGKRFAAACGVLICHSSHNEISDNEICYTDYTGISVGWVWGYRPSSTYGNLIKNNHIHHIGMGNLSDMGGIYLLGAQNGTVLYGNHIHDVSSRHYGGWGIYTDEGSSYITVEKNVVYRCKCECYHQHYGSFNTVRDNVFAFGGQHLIRMSRSDAHVGIVVENNILITDGTPVYTAFDFDFRGTILSLQANNNTFYDVSGKAPVITAYEMDGVHIENTLSRWQTGTGKDIASKVKKPSNIKINKESKTVKLLKTR